MFQINLNVTYVGKCSLCGGRVTRPWAWWGTNMPHASCEQCGAVEEDNPGPIIKMKRQPNGFGDYPQFINGG